MANGLDFNDYGGDDDKVDIQGIKNAALADLPAILHRYLPGGKVKGNEYECASIDGGDGASCRTNLTTGVGSDFAADKSWGDPIDLVAKIKGVSQTEAARILRDDMGLTPTFSLQNPKESKEDKHERGRAEALGLWMSGKECSQHHPYLTNKGVSASNALKMIDGGEILVPLCDDRGVMWNIQRIYPNGKKYFMKDARVDGCFFTFPGDQSMIYLAEGYSTAATVATLTGHMTIMACNTANLPKVAKVIAKLHPRSEIIFAADYDDKGDGKNPGVEAANKARNAIGRGEVLPPPGNVKQDWNDYYLQHGADRARAGLTVKRQIVRILDWGIDVFLGEPKPQEWIVENILPRGKAATFAAQGDTGKGFLTLDLALKIASGQGRGVDLNERSGWFGNKVATHGKVVIFSAEDDLDEMSRRIRNLDEHGILADKVRDNLFMIPLPDACGPRHLVIGNNGDYQASPWFEELKAQMMEMDNLALINFDPLASFVGVDIDADNQAGQFVMGMLAHLAKQCNAAVLVAHHMRKGTKGTPTSSPEDARRDIRGASSLVDGVRTAIALWQSSEKSARITCKALGEPFKRNKVCQGAVVKANGPADREIKTFVRNEETGLLEVRSEELLNAKTPEKDKLEILIGDIAHAAEVGQPFCFSAGGQAGVHTRRHGDLSEMLRDDISKHAMQGMIESLVRNGDLVACTMGKAQTRWLDVPYGDLALNDGSYTFEPGFIEKHR